MRKNTFLLLLCVLGYFAQAQPNAPQNVTANPSYACPGATVNLSATVTAPNQVNWYTVPTGGTAIGTTASGANLSVIPTATTTYYAEAAGVSGSITLGHTGNVQSWTVPAGITSITVDAKGASGIDGTAPIVGGNGGRVQATLTVTPGQILYIYVGGEGGNNTGGYNSNASGRMRGGGATDMRTTLNNTATRILVAGGGGAASSSANGGNGGNPATAGANGIAFNGTPTNGGGAATTTAAGAAGTGVVAGAVGTSTGVGGLGGNSTGTRVLSGGNGGGGYFGGGGGGANNTGNNKSAGGGGGSSFVSNGTNVTYTSGDNDGNGSISITWQGPVSTTREPVSVSIVEAPTNIAVANITATTAELNWASSIGSGYQWKIVLAGAGVNAAAVASGSTTTVLTATATGLTGATNYDLYMRSSCLGGSFSDWSNAVSFTSGTPCISPSVFSVTGGGTYCDGGTGVSVGLSGSQTGVEYSLYLDGLALGNTISGTGNALSFGPQNIEGTYTIEATDAATNTCTTMMTGSAIAVLSLMDTASVSIAITTGSQNINYGTLVTFTATPQNGGTSPIFQWKRNGLNVGSNSLTYTNSNLGNGDVIACEMTSNQSCVVANIVTSSNITMTVANTPTPDVTISQNDSVICAGNDAIFTLTGDIGAVVTYQLNSGANATTTLNAGTATITVTNALIDQTLDLISITNGGITEILNESAIILVNPLPSVSGDTINTVCEQTSVDLSTAVTTSAIITGYYSNSTLTIPVPTPTNVTVAGFYYVEVNNGTLPECTNKATIWVAPFKNSTSATTNITACDTYSWSVNGTTYTSSGTYTAISTNAAGCTHTDTLNLTINNSTSNTTSATACDTYFWSVNGTTYTSSGTYTATSTNAAGCTHVETLNLTINNSTSTTTNATACDTYSWSVNGSTYTTSGTYTATSTNAAGCTHTETLNLTINNSTTSTTSATACDTYTWAANGQTYTSSGTSTATSINAAGCTHTSTLNLTINNSTTSTTSATACDTYTWAANGQTYTTSGTYTATSINAAGCTHIATLNLTINNSTTSTTSATACDTYTWAANGQTYTTSGTYTATSINAAGCTHTATLNLTINNSTTSTTSATACDTYTWAANGQTYTTSGTYTATSTNAAGCPHTATLNLTINNSTTSTTSATACDTYTWAANGQTYTTSGTYTATSTNAAGCTHTATLNLTINNSTTSTTSATACDTYTWAANGQTYTTSGTYTATSTNAAGCTHTETLNLTINNSTTSTTSVNRLRHLYMGCKRSNLHNIRYLHSNFY